LDLSNFVLLFSSISLDLRSQILTA
jgi:hypothetical protein